MDKHRVFVVVCAWLKNACVLEGVPCRGVIHAAQGKWRPIKSIMARVAALRSVAMQRFAHLTGLTECAVFLIRVSPRRTEAASVLLLVKKRTLGTDTRVLSSKATFVLGRLGVDASKASRRVVLARQALP